MIYDKIKELATKQGITICTLEKRAGLGNGVIRKWNTSSPSISSLQSVAKELNVTINKLIE